MTEGVCSPGYSSTQDNYQYYARKGINRASTVKTVVIPSASRSHFCSPDSRRYKNVSEDYLGNIIKRFLDPLSVFDALIITGAPLENMPFEQVFLAEQ